MSCATVQRATCETVRTADARELAAQNGFVQRRSTRQPVVEFPWRNRKTTAPLLFFSFLLVLGSKWCASGMTWDGSSSSSSAWSWWALPIGPLLRPAHPWMAWG